MSSFECLFLVTQRGKKVVGDTTLIILMDDAKDIFRMKSETWRKPSGPSKLDQRLNTLHSAATFKCQRLIIQRRGKRTRIKNHWPPCLVSLPWLNTLFLGHQNPTWIYTCIYNLFTTITVLIVISFNVNVND